MGEWIVRLENTDCENALFYRFREGGKLHLAICDYLMVDLINGVHHKTCLKAFDRGILKKCPYTTYLD
jgi:hypothetical protein